MTAKSKQNSNKRRGIVIIDDLRSSFDQKGNPKHGINCTGMRKKEVAAYGKLGRY